MFTIEQIKEAHSKVKSGADFPDFIRELKNLGVISYESFVADGHTIYKGENNFQSDSSPRYDKFSIAKDSNIEGFKNDLILHQQGKSDYTSFCNQCAKHGIEKWEVDLHAMTCIYFNSSGQVVLQEKIPS